MEPKSSAGAGAAAIDRDQYVPTLRELSLVTGRNSLGALAAPQAVLAVPPAALELTFNEKLQDDFTTVRLSLAGRNVSLGDTGTGGAVVTQPMPADLSAGTYTVVYRVVSADGHPISGKLSFRLAAPSPQDNASASAASPADAPRPSSVNTAADDPAAAASDDGGPGWRWIVGAVVMVLLVVGGVLVAGRRRRPPSGA